MAQAKPAEEPNEQDDNKRALQRFYNVSKGRRASRDARPPPTEARPACEGDECLVQQSAAPERVLSLLRSGGKQKFDKRGGPVAMWNELTEVKTMAVVPGMDVVCTAGGVPHSITVRRVDEKVDDEEADCCGCFGWMSSNKHQTNPYAPQEELYVARREHRLTGHKKEIIDLQVSLDEGARFLFSAGRDGRCIVWDTATWEKRTQRVTDRVGDVASLARGHVGLTCVAPMRGASHHVCLASEDHRLRMWDLAANKTVLKFSDTNAAMSIVAAQPHLIYTGDREGHIRLWDTRTGQAEGLLASHTAQVGYLKYDEDRDHLFSSSFDATVKKWATPSSSPADAEVTFRGHRGIVRDFAVHNGHLYSCSINSTVRIWHLHTAENVSTLLLSSWPNAIRSLNNDLLALGLDGGVVTLWRQFEASTEPASPQRHSHHLPCPASVQGMEAANLMQHTYVLARAAAPNDTQQRYAIRRTDQAGLPSVEAAIEAELRCFETDESRRRVSVSLLKKGTGTLASTHLPPERVCSTDLLEMPEEGTREERRASVQFQLDHESRESSQPPSPPSPLASPSLHPSELSFVSGQSDQDPEKKALRAKIMKLRDALNEMRAEKDRLALVGPRRPVDREARPLMRPHTPFGDTFPDEASQSVSISHTPLFN
eukprot:TRINITY_DN20596_c0_g1_i2.p1 TRINITY_DN20596_c0_g1~~TRINITY_DN20596_c0_g1_i2.p1  ORF type:complete len:655 (+),score=207.94 TRINITY_DN20596_c0_g1_i2:71-2035(+)